MSSASLNVGTWMPAEDDRLKVAVTKHGPRWVVVAAEVGTRNGDQCAKRWNENLNPELDQSPWCLVEDKLLLRLVQLHGHRWKFIANKFFEKRAPLSLKNRNSYLERRQKRQNQSRISQQRGSQAPPTSLSPTTLNSTGSVALSDTPFETTGIIPLGPDDSYGDISYNGSPGIAESELAESLSRGSSSMGFSDVFSTFVPKANAKQDPQSSTLYEYLEEAKDPIKDSQITYMPDSADWHHFMNNSAAFDYLGDDNAMGSHCTASKGDSIPVLNLFDNSNLNEEKPTVAASTSSDDTVKYSLTCPRGKVKSLIQHLIDAAMPVNMVPGVLDEQQVVLHLTLRMCGSAGH